MTVTAILCGDGGEQTKQANSSTASLPLCRFCSERWVGWYFVQGPMSARRYLNAHWDCLEIFLRGSFERGTILFL